MKIMTKVKFPCLTDAARIDSYYKVTSTVRSRYMIQSSNYLFGVSVTSKVLVQKKIRKLS